MPQSNTKFQENSTQENSQRSREQTPSPPIPPILNSSSPRVGVLGSNDSNIEKDFDARIGIDRGRESSNGGYLAQEFTDAELNPPLAPYAHTYQGGHAPEAPTFPKTSSQKQ